jgi:hypothetical protein
MRKCSTGLSQREVIAAGLQRTFKPVKDVADKAGECWVRAELRLAEELSKIPRAVGARAGGKKESPRGPIVEPRDQSPPLADLGVPKKRAARAQKLAAIPEAKATKKHAVATAAFSEVGP